MTELTLEPDQEVVRIFWQVSREHVGWTAIENLIGSRIDSSLLPPAGQFSDDRQEATDIAQSIRDGATTETSIELAAYEGQDIPLPEVGDLMIVCDGAGIPLALIRTTAVDVDDTLVVEKFTSLYPPLPQQKKS